MHLNEFADPKIYALPADGMAAVLNQLENIWLDRGLEDDNAHIRRSRRQPNDRRRKLTTSGDATGLSGSHVGGIYRPCVRDSAREFSSSQPIAANPLFKGPTDYFSGALPIGIRWIKRGRNRHQRVPRVSNGDVDWESQTDVAHFYPDVVGDFIDRLSNDVALCVECIVCRRVVLMFDGVHMVFLQGVGYLSSLA